MTKVSPVLCNLWRLSYVLVYRNKRIDIEGARMNKEQAVKRRDVVASLASWLPAVGQLAALIVVATALILPAPMTSNQLPAGRLGSDLMINSWPTALLIQRTFAQEHRWPLWNPYYARSEERRVGKERSSR